MIAAKFTCPACAARLNSAKPIPSGKRIKCPRCGTGFPGPAAASNDAAADSADKCLRRLPSAYVAGAALVLLVAGGTGLVLAISGIGRNKLGEPVVNVAEVEDPPKPVPGSADLRPQATSQAARPAPETHETGGERNPILVAGTPPLDQDTLDRWSKFTEWVLDVRLTEQQRQEYQRLFINDWKTLDQAVKASTLKNTTQGLLAQLPLLNGYYQNLLRAQRQSKYLSHLRKCSKDELSGFLLALFASAHRPGGESNPVLVQGETALTQEMVSRYGDFLEWVLDLRASGGLTAAQRRELKELIASAWVRMSKPEKNRFLTLLNNWSKIPQLDEASRARYQQKAGGEFLAQLRDSPNQEHNRWLLAVYDQEQKSVKQQTSNQSFRTGS